MRFTAPTLRWPSYVRDWSPVSWSRFAHAQKSERSYWSSQDRQLLTLHAQYYYYAGFYEWARHRALLNPFRIDPARPQNFQLRADEIAGRTLLDIGCGPMSWTLSLVHCASVHVVDPLATFYREIQPFGWDFFASVASSGAERLPFDTGTFDLVHCWNVLDHTRSADEIMKEIVRVLRPRGELLIGCDVRSKRGGGAPHPYKWNRETFEARLFAEFEPMTAVALLAVEEPVGGHEHQGVNRWTCRLRKRS